MAHPSAGFGTQGKERSVKEIGPSLEWLLHPTSPKTFFAEYFEKQTLVVKRNAPEYFQGLLSLDEIDRVITTLDRNSDQIILKNAAREITSDDYTIDGAIDVAKLYQLFHEGSTITLAFLDDVVPALTRFCRSLEREFTCPLQTNIYLTPPGAQGAKAHYDTHDVFVLQVAGSKKWTIYGTPVELPLPSQDFDAAIHEVGHPTMEFELEAGDVAYVPRGAAHDARSTDTTSLHITAGILRYTWTDLLLEFVASASLRDATFRKSLPPGFARSDFDREQARETLRDLLQRASTNGDFNAALDRFAGEFFSKCPPLLRGQMTQMAALEKLSAESIAGIRDGAIYRMDADGYSVAIECYGRQITFPAQAREAVEFALSHSRYAIRDLPGNLDDASKVTIVRRLIREGLVEAVIPE
ncbi:MAG TPA: cupin domain-containing protein [Candidatus Acidoferrales bacterium]|nr:cupin domain-containing protein [Candidatus Acidoferrales bacterium]